MKNIFFAVLVLFSTNFISEPPKDFESLWKSYHDAVAQYPISKNSDYISLNKILADIEGEIVKTKNYKESFLLVYLRGKVLLSKAEIIRIRIDKREVQLTSLKKTLDDLINNQKIFVDSTAAVKSFDRDTKPKTFTALGIEQADASAFKAKCWTEYIDKTDIYIREQENYIFNSFLGDKITIRRVTEFIRFSVYNSNIALINHKATDAFDLYYKLKTFDGEPLTIRTFKTHIEQDLNAEPWLDLYKKYKTIYDIDLKNAVRWGQIVNNTSSNPDDLKKVIDEAAPREIAYQALLKLIKMPVLTNNHALALQTLDTYRNKFEGQIPYYSMENKFSELYDLINGVIESDIMYELTPVSELNSTLKNPVTFFLNKKKNHLALLPMQRVKLNVFSFGRNLSNFSKKSMVDFDPAFEIYTFDPFDPQKENTIIRYHKTEDLDLNAISGDKNSSDFNFSGRYAVAFFSSLSASERLDTLTSCPEYASPWLSHHKSLRFFQESEDSEKFHGKEHGNLNTDIYYCFYENGKWREPHLLKSSAGEEYNINTAFSERSPILDADGQTLYFASEGHAGFGGFDIFKSTIRIDKENLKVTSIEPPQNMGNLNTVFDEIFYTPVRDSFALMTSNREDNVYKIYKSVSKKRIVNQPRKKRKDIVGLENILDMNEPANFSASCDTLKEPDDGILPGTIRVLGRIFDKNKNLLPNARITFIPPNKKPAQGFVDFAKGDSVYQVFLPYNTSNIIVHVFGISETGDSVIGEYSTKLDILCDNKDKSKVVIADYKTTPVAEIIENQEPNYVPFFFDTNVSNQAINEDDKSTLASYQVIIEEFKNNKIRFVVRGFADERGDDVYNYRLSKKRAETAFKILTEKCKYVPTKVTTKWSGKTREFNDDERKYPFYIPDNMALMLQNTKQRLWFQNRRVMVYKEYIK